MTATATKSRRPSVLTGEVPNTPKVAAPVTGTVKIIQAVDANGAGAGAIAINGVGYALYVREGGYRLTVWDEARRHLNTYDLPADLCGCDCPDSVWRVRVGGCKHKKALSKLFEMGKIPACPAAPTTDDTF